MVIVALDHVPRCYTWEDGTVIGGLIREAFSKGEDAVVSFRDVSDVPSSFVNGAFVTLLDDYDFSFIKSHLSIVESNSAINNMIRRRMSFEAERRHAADRPVTEELGPSPT